MSDAGLVEERRQFNARIRELEQQHTALLAALAMLVTEMQTIAHGYRRDPDEIARARGDVWAVAAIRLDAILAKHRKAR